MRLRQAEGSYFQPVSLFLPQQYSGDIIDDNYTFDENTDFIQKPISPNGLVAKVGEMLVKCITGSVNSGREVRTDAGGGV